MKEIVLVKKENVEKENVKKEFQQSNPKTFDEKKKELWKSYPQNQNTFPERKILAQAENSSKEQIEKESEVVIEKPNFDKIENISPEKKPDF